MKFGDHNHLRMGAVVTGDPTAECEAVARSWKKHPGGGIAVAESDKWFKTSEHRRERRHVAAAVKKLEEPLPRDWGNPYRSSKDGKQYWVDHDARWMRK